MQWFSMLVCACVIPVMSIVMGVFLLKVSYKNKYCMYAYRSKLATMNKDTWEFAQKTAGTIWIKVGILLLILAVVVMVLTRSFDVNMLGKVVFGICLVEILVFASASYPVEKKLQETFEMSGVRK